MNTFTDRYCDECGAPNRSIGKFCVACGKPLSMYANKTQSSSTGLISNATVLKQRYHIVRKIGEGGFSAVYFAEDNVFNAAPRVVKEMSMQSADSQPIDPQDLAQSIEGFKQEALLLATLTHPHLPRIYDHFEEQQHWYIVMDYIEGQTLEKLLENAPGGKLEVPLVLRIANQLCTVLHYLHNRQPPIIFRDLKPANIMLTEDEHIYLIDFGIARLFKPGQARDTVALGSPGYAAPEQYGRAQSTAQADIYSLGATLHHLLSGCDPSENPFQFPPLVLKQHATGPALASLIQRMVALQTQQRPASIEEVKQELQGLAQVSTPINPTLPSPPPAPQQYAANPTHVPLIDRIAALQAERRSTSVEEAKQELLQRLAQASTPVSPTLPSQPVTPSAAQSPHISSPGPMKTVIVDRVDGNYSSISAAIRNVPEGTHILVRPGTYTESIVLDKNVEIVGDGPREEILLTCENACGIRMATDQALVRGLTIRVQSRGHHAIDIPRGQLHLSDCIIASEALACISIYNSTAQPLIQRCILRNGRGSGIKIYNDSAGVIEDCEISGVVTTGISVSAGANPVVRRCKIHDGKMGGIFVSDQAEGTFEDCEISGHQSIGVQVDTGGKPVMRRCTIHHGQSAGIHITDRGEGTFEDCEISANYSIGVQVGQGGKPVLRRCTIHHGQSAGIHVTDRGEGTFEDCETFANKSFGLHISNGGNPVLRRCKIHHEQSAGIYVSDQGAGTLEDCETFANKSFGLHIAKGGNPILRGCKIRDRERHDRRSYG